MSNPKPLQYPSEGGSYIRQPDGTLVRQDETETPPAIEPPEVAASAQPSANLQVAAAEASSDAAELERLAEAPPPPPRRGSATATESKKE